MRFVPRKSFAHRITLPRLAAATWLLSVALLSLMTALLWGRVWHPHFLPTTVLLAALFVAGLFLICGGVWRIARGPGRVRAAGWLLVGVAPLLLLSGHFGYGISVGSGRLVRLNTPLKLLIPLGESIMDLEAHV